MYKFPPKAKIVGGHGRLLLLALDQLPRVPRGRAANGLAALDQAGKNVIANKTYVTQRPPERTTSYVTSSRTPLTLYSNGSSHFGRGWRLLSASTGHSQHVRFFTENSMLKALQKELIATEKQDGNNNNNILHTFASGLDVHEFDRQLCDVLSTGTGKVSISKFLKALKMTGLQLTDPRLRQLLCGLKKIRQQAGETQDLVDRDLFSECVRENIVLIAQAFRNEFVIPEFPKFRSMVEQIYVKCKSNHTGSVASYIPQLFRCSPDLWGVSLCTVNGQRHSMGDSQVPFCLQSCSKPLSYLVALNEHGPGVIHEYVGQEPSGHGFNDIKLDSSNKPHNPMINAGAMVTVSLIKSGLPLADRFDYISKEYKRLAGEEFVGFNNAVFLSERETADRNFALGYYLREHKCFPEGVNLIETLDFYFQLCSVEVTCESASVMAATLANGGICPLTGERVVSSLAVRDTLSLMHSCGMYDYSGQFAFKVGLPAKSGVSGAIIIVVPNVMGICVYSPPLDHLGNSCRGIQFCEELVNIFNFHHFDNLKHSAKKMDPRRHWIDKEGQVITSLLFAAFNGDLTAIRRMQLAGMDMTRADYDGRTALHLSSAEGHVECVNFLLQICNVPVNPRDRWDHTPLDDAQKFGHEKVAEILEKYQLEEGA